VVLLPPICGTISRVAAITKRKIWRCCRCSLSYGLVVVQPSLAVDSRLTHLVAVHRSGVHAAVHQRARDHAVPSASRAAEGSSAVAGTMSGPGLDIVWRRRPQSGRGRCTILGVIQVQYARCVRELAPATVRNGAAPTDEEARLNRLCDIAVQITPLVFALDPTGGRRIRCGAAMPSRHWRAFRLGRTSKPCDALGQNLR
jgi:hypothetical protein